MRNRCDSACAFVCTCLNFLGPILADNPGPGKVRSRVFFLAGVRKKEYDLGMEKNDLILINDIIYRLYDRTMGEEQKEKALLPDLRRMLRCPYASILHAAGEKNGVPVFADPVCDPDSFLPAEEAYLTAAPSDHMLWSAEAGHTRTFRESAMLNADKRRQTRIYSACYEPFGVYDTLQANLFDKERFLGTLSLYHTRKEGEFTDEDVFLVQLLAPHLARLLMEREGEGGRLSLVRERVHTVATEYGLTKREEQVLLSLLSGNPDETIAKDLAISPGTLRKHVQHIYRKLGIRARRELLPLLGGQREEEKTEA